MTVEGYDVLRMIEHNRLCYISSEYIHGEQLVRWLKYHPNLSKERLFSWIQKMAVRLEQFHKCRGQPCYKYVNPYSMIVTEDGELYFLDLKADSNKSRLRNMQRRSVREYFLPPDASCYQQSSVELDLYGLGKTMQYMLAASDPVPKLSKREELKFQRVISRCLNRQSLKSFQNSSDILKHLPVYRHKSYEKVKTEKKKFRKTVCLTGLLLVLAGMVICVKSQENKEDDIRAAIARTDGEEERPVDSPENASMKKQAKARPGNSKTGTGKMGKTDRLHFEMGLLYLLDTGECDEALSCFSKAQGDLAVNFRDITECFVHSGGMQNKQKLKETLSQAEKNLDREALPEKDWKNSIRVLMKGYSILDTAEAAEEIIRLGKGLPGTNENAEPYDDAKKETAEYMAAAYEVSGDAEAAASMYEELLTQETEKDKREELMKKLAVLWDQAGKTDMAWECCRKGLEEYEDSTELWLLYIGLQLKDPAVDRTVCAETIQECTGKIPEIKELEEYKKLEREYEIHMEGDKICVGK